MSATAPSRPTNWTGPGAPWWAVSRCPWKASSSLLSRAMQLKEYNFPADYWDKYPAAVMKLTAEQVRQTARKYVPVDDIQIVAVGDADKIREQLKKFGAVEEVSADRP